MITTFASRYYLSGGTRAKRRGSHLPREILIPAEFDDRELVEDILSDEAGRRIRLYARRRGRRYGCLSSRPTTLAMPSRIASPRWSRSKTGLRQCFTIYGDRLDLKVVPASSCASIFSHHQDPRRSEAPSYSRTVHRRRANTGICGSGEIGERRLPFDGRGRLQILPAQSE